MTKRALQAICSGLILGSGPEATYLEQETCAPEHFSYTVSRLLVAYQCFVLLWQDA